VAYFELRLWGGYFADPDAAAAASAASYILTG
jgi:hypothetical protein